jgi:predicted phage baseplate assembly protein
VLNEPGVVQVVLPPAAELATWEFTEPLTEGTGDFPPTLDDQQLAVRLVTWVRLRLPTPTPVSTSTSNASNQPAVTDRNGSLDADLTWVGINATTVIQAIPVVNESLGKGTGEPDQTVTLANSPVLTDTLNLQIQDVSGNGVFQTWRLIDDLLSAGMTDRVFSADSESGILRFGTGLNGARPGPNCLMRVSYQFGGGTAGNVAAGAVKSSPDPRLQGTFTIANPTATWGGTDGETTDQGQQRIPLYLRHRDRLVTTQDFVDVTMSAAGVNVGRVEVLPLYRPPTSDLPNPPLQVPGTVTVMVIPATDAVQPLWPMPDSLFLQKVCDWLNPRRLVTTELFVRGPVYVPVYLSIGIEILPGNFRDVVIAAVIRAMQAFLSSLPAGGPAGTGWPINKNVLKAELEAVADRVTGVDYVDSVLMAAGDSPTTDVTTVTLVNLQLPLLAQVSVVQGQPAPLSQLSAPPGPAILPVPVTRSKC